MTERITSEVYWSDCSVGDRHWVTGQAYPPSAYEHYSTPKLLDFHADVHAVYGASVPGSDVAGGESWGVRVADPAEEAQSKFTVGIPDRLPSDSRYQHLVEHIEHQLGRTSLKILVY